jgi:hypothetical protein
MSSRRIRAVPGCLAAALALLAGGGAGAALAATAPVAADPGGSGGVASVDGGPIPKGPDAVPWATINVCDPIERDGAVGVRGSMPGTGDRDDELFMRLQLQFFRRSDGAWRSLGGTGDSGFLDVGNGAARVRQAGRTFMVAPPVAGDPAFLLRGLVTFEWRRDGIVTRRARRVTAGGHAGTPGADPPDFSAPACSVR